MIELSFIVPVYNGEQFIRHLTDNLMSQVVSPSRFEVIFVDDCSVDSSPVILEELSAAYQNFRFIRHEKNTFLATACNTGLKYAKGKYVWIIDQDDFIQDNCVEYLLEILKKNNLDLLLFNYNRVDSCGRVIDSPCVFEDSSVINGKQFIDTYFKSDFDKYILGYRWRAIFSRDFLDRKGIHFIDGMMYDDTTFLMRSILLSSRMASISTHIYNYRVNNSSITYSKGKRGEMIYEFAFKVGDEVLNFANYCNCIDQSYSTILKRCAIKYYNSFVIDLMRTSRKEQDVFYSVVNSSRSCISRIKPLLKPSSRLFLLQYFGPLLLQGCSLIYRFKHSIGR